MCLRAQVAILLQQNFSHRQASASMKPFTSFIFLLLTLLPSIFYPTSVCAQLQPFPNRSAAEIQLELDKMQVMGTLLYVAAHPDDENTRLITWSAQEAGLETTYLSLTRGDGGQNLIGKEVREQLGLIRTHELLQARLTDGGHQLFSRANDFGYSKTPKEAIAIWDRDAVLADVVWAIRKTQPDVIITRFSPTRGETHGHHTASAMLAVEAFRLAADPKAYPEQLAHVKPWQATRILWNTSPFFFRNNREFDRSQLISLDLGGYNPLLGRSLGEIGAMSRSMHKSQGFGAAMQRGEQIEYLQHLEGKKADKDLFEGIDLTWGRIPGGEPVGALLAQAAQAFNPRQPHLVVPLLAEALRQMRALPAQSSTLLESKKARLELLILQCAGIWAEATAKEYSLSPGDSLYLTARCISRSPVPVTLEELHTPIATWKADSVLRFNQMATVEQGLVVPASFVYSQPYWLSQPFDLGMFTVPDQTLRGLPENPPAMPVGFQFRIGQPGKEITIRYTTPTLFRWVDPAKGERYRTLEIAPPITLNMDKEVLIFADQQPKELRITAKANQSALAGTITLRMPDGWTTDPPFHTVAFSEKYQEKNLIFRVKPSAKEVAGSLSAEFESNGQRFSYALTRISYDHIPIQTLYPPASIQVAKASIVRKGNGRIGYIVGAGDAIPEALREVGYTVDILDENNLTIEKLLPYQAVITGVRAWNTVERLRFAKPTLMEYVEQGGNLIVQYNTSFGLVTPQIGPYPFTISRERVTEEEAEMKFIDPTHPLLNAPNQLTAADFAGWVQERGLYYAGEWDSAYTPIFSAHDEGEPARDGGLIVARHGKGYFMYTGLAFFRQLPAGVPGAYRLFANMISMGQQQP